MSFPRSVRILIYELSRASESGITFGRAPRGHATTMADRHAARERARSSLEFVPYTDTNSRFSRCGLGVPRRGASLVAQFPTRAKGRPRRFPHARVGTRPVWLPRFNERAGSVGLQSGR